MSRQHKYDLTITWRGNKGQGTNDYRSYDRSHTVSITNKQDILCSSDPLFRGDKTKHNPEELLVASLSGCHMLWYLQLCAEAGVIVTEYVDNAWGTMVETADGGGHFKEVTLNPIVTVTENSMIVKANELHKNANALCFIANSVNFPVNHAPTCIAVDK